MKEKLKLFTVVIGYSYIDDDNRSGGGEITYKVVAFNNINAHKLGYKIFNREVGKSLPTHANVYVSVIKEKIPVIN